MVPRGHPCSSMLQKSCLKSPRLPLLLREVEKHKRERQEGLGAGGREGGRIPPCPAANPSSALRGISNNKRPWSRPDGFDLITKQGGSGSFQSLPRGWILCKQQRATWCKSKLELQTAQMLPEMLGLPWLWERPPAPWELLGSRPPTGHRAVPNAQWLRVSDMDMARREKVKGSRRQCLKFPQPMAVMSHLG